MSKTKITKNFESKSQQAIYAEPFSHYDGDRSGKGGLKWDGKTKQDTFEYEFEVLLNNGYEYELLDVDLKDGTYTVKMRVLGRTKSYWAKNGAITKPHYFSNYQ